MSKSAGVAQASGAEQKPWVSKETRKALWLGVALFVATAVAIAAMGGFEAGNIVNGPSFHQISQYISDNWWQTALVGMAILFGPAIAYKAAKAIQERWEKSRATAKASDALADANRDDKNVRADATKVAATNTQEEALKPHLHKLAKGERVGIKLAGGNKKFFYLSDNNEVSSVTFTKNGEKIAGKYYTFDDFKKAHPESVGITHLEKRLVAAGPAPSAPPQPQARRTADAGPLAPEQPKAKVVLTPQDAEKQRTIEANLNKLDEGESTGFKLENGGFKVFYRNNDGKLRSAMFKEDGSRIEGNYKTLDALTKKYNPIKSKDLIARPQIGAKATPKVK